MWDKLKDWYLALIGIIVIAGGLYVASHTGSINGAAKESKQTESVSSATELAKAPSAPDRSSPQTPASAQTASAAKVSAAPVTSKAPPTAAENDTSVAHNHSAANQPQTNVAQAPAAAPALASTPAPAPASSAGPIGATAAPIAGGDPAAGKLVFRKCQVCHSLDAGKDILGPSLAGIIGRKSGAAPNYAYSPAMKDANLTWDAKTLDAYLDDPQKMVPGNKMPFPGLKTAQDRLDVIAYMAAPAGSAVAQTSPPAPAAQPGAQAQPSATAPIPAYVPDARYTLRSGIAEGRMVYIGVGGERR